MDPNAALREALEALSDLNAHHLAGDADEAAYARETAVERLRALADWLDSGGFPPVFNMAEGGGRGR